MPLPVLAPELPPPHPRLAPASTRNGLPEPGGYTWHGTDRDRDDDITEQVQAAKRQARRNYDRHQQWLARQLQDGHRLDIQEAVDGPSPEWWRELRDWQ